MNTQFSTYTANNILPKVAYNPLNTNAKTCMMNYRYGFNGQEKINEVYGFGNLNIAEFWLYDTRLGRRWNRDPIDQISMSNYSVLSNSPIIRIDPNGDNDNPIYDKNDGFLGTDDRGLQGEAIIMDKADFKQGMSHEEALEKGKYFYQLDKVERFNFMEKNYGHWQGLKYRPDWDGYLTKKEADEWWRGKSGQPLFVDQSKIELPDITTQSFDNIEGKDGSFYKNFIWGLSNTGKVYGTLKLTLLHANSGTVYIGGQNYLDEYDFTMDNRPLRNFATWWGRPGKANDGKNFFIYGYGHGQVPVKK